MFKTRLDTFGNDFGHFWIFEIFFGFLKTFRRLHPPWNTGQKEISKESTPKHVQNTFGQFGNVFGRFWIFEIFLIFLKHFEDSTLHGTLGKTILSKKIPQNMFKTRLDNLGTNLGVFAISKLFKFFENISKTRPSLEHWARKISEKSIPKHVQNTFGQFGNNFGRFWSFETFLIF